LPKNSAKLPHLAPDSNRVPDEKNPKTPVCPNAKKKVKRKKKKRKSNTKRKEKEKKMSSLWKFF
jgi:hypothetical protein